MVQTSHRTHYVEDGTLRVFTERLRTDLLNTQKGRTVDQVKWNGDKTNVECRGGGTLISPYILKVGSLLHTSPSVPLFFLVIVIIVASIVIDLIIVTFVAAIHCLPWWATASRECFSPFQVLHVPDILQLTMLWFLIALPLYCTTMPCWHVFHAADTALIYVLSNTNRLRVIDKCDRFLGPTVPGMHRIITGC